MKWESIKHITIGDLLALAIIMKMKFKEGQLLAHKFQTEHNLSMEDFRACVKIVHDLNLVQY